MAIATVEAFLAGSQATIIRRPIAPAIRPTAAGAGATVAAEMTAAEVMAAAEVAAIDGSARGIKRAQA